MGACTSVRGRHMGRTVERVRERGGGSRKWRLAHVHATKPLAWGAGVAITRV